MWERLHILLREPREIPGVKPRPGPNVRNGVFALSITSQIFTWGASVFATQLDLEHAVDAEGLVAVSFDGVFGSTLSALLPYVWIREIWMETYKESSPLQTSRNDLLALDRGRRCHAVCCVP